MTYQAAWRSPSNIALIKYWGKHGVQLPRNPSLSFTLSTCYTEMQIAVELNSSPGLKVFYDKQPAPAFEPKIISLFDKLRNEMLWLKTASVTINSHNTFPHGAGIASSASSMSALALCLHDIDQQIHAKDSEKDTRWLQSVSETARLGSGSACRSVYPVAALWGKTDHIPISSDDYAIPWKDEIHPIFHSYQDTILIVSSTEKSVSSSAGHALMNDLPYAEVRYAEARNNLATLIECMKYDDRLEEFISICESEALQLHALMMSGQSPYILMEPNTLAIIREVWRFRKETGVPVCFTLDAGPNVHLLYPHAYQDRIHAWINNDLIQFCALNQYIPDQAGNGPEKRF